MNPIAVCFWASAALVAYTYLVYPMILACAARLRTRPVSRGPFRGSASFVVAARNEEHRIAARRDELVALLDAAGLDGDVVIVSDGSTDATAAAARLGAGARVKVIEIPENVGKAASLTRGFAAASGDVIVFADARQRWAPDALRLLLEHFDDPTVGGASGDLCLETTSGACAGVGLYWRYEKAVRRLEGRIHSTIGATGAISAVRRRLFRPIPAGTVLDDVYWPMQVVLQGYRVVHDHRARAFDRLPDNAGDEFRRKVRTLAGNFQLVARLPVLVVPWRNPVWFQFVSHKLLRLMVPWLLIAMLATCAMLPGQGYRAWLAAQLAGFALATVGLHSRIAARWRIASAASSFLVLNAAAWTAFWVWVRGRTQRSWQKVSYAAPVVVAASASATADEGLPSAVHPRGATALPLGCLALAAVGAWTAAAGAASPTRPAATAATLFVSEAGNDLNPGTDAAPFRTLQRAADVVRPGDVVRVRRGTYAGMNFFKGQGGTPEHQIQFRADRGVVINTCALTGPNRDSGINLEPGRGWIEFSGFHIVNADGSMERASIRVAGNDHVRLIDNDCEKGGNWGIFTSLSSDLFIEDNRCSGTPGQHGIYVSRGARRVTIRHNTLHDNHWDGLHLNGGMDGPIDRCLIENNVIYANELSGVDCDGVQNSTFRNNLVYGNQKHAVTLYNHDTASGCSGNVFVNNTFVSGSMFAIQMRQGSSRNTLYNNILWHDRPSVYGSVGVDQNAEGLVSDYNVVVDHFSSDLGSTHMTLALWRGRSGQDAHSVVVQSAERLFVDRAHDDFHLRVDSPARGAGGALPAPNDAPSTDLEGQVRPPERRADAGAYVFTR